MTPIIDSLDDISGRFRAVYCDLWGCLHNGVRPFPQAMQALERFRDKGGYVLLLTNAPRPGSVVVRQLDRLGVPRSLYHAITTSGDAARHALANGEFGRAVYHIGPPRDLGFFAPGTELHLAGLARVNRVPFPAAEGIVCTGLFDDETETPDDYREILSSARDRGLAMLCANPDVIVDRGPKRVFCAGSLAAMYETLGGTVSRFGKPFRSIYSTARMHLDQAVGPKSRTNRHFGDQDILCIGDGIHTDIRGAADAGLASLFVTGGLAQSETGTEYNPDRRRLEDFLARAAPAFRPTAAIGHLR